MSKRQKNRNVIFTGVPGKAMRAPRPRKPRAARKVRVKAIGGPYAGQTLLYSACGDHKTLTFVVTQRLRTSKTGHFTSVRWHGHYDGSEWVPLEV
jgi:hypothetical protein